MKLFSKYYRANIAVTIIVMLISGFCYYLLLHFILLEQLDDALSIKEQEVVDYVKHHNSLPDSSSYEDQQINFTLSAGNKEREFSTIELYDKEENKMIPARQLTFPIKVKGNLFEVHILQSQDEAEELMQFILAITLTVAVLLLLILFLLNRFILNRLWKPFNLTLLQLKRFNLSGKDNLQLEPSDIKEFRELNEAFNTMAGRVNREYVILKNFTENASHEMQTPLAIINSKLDVLIQDENISEQQLGHLQEIYNVLERLSKMNQSLLLLTKIENNQFPETENLRLDNVIQEKFLQFEEIISNKGLFVKRDIQPVCITCNRHLLEIMLGNLINNAIHYNREGGLVSIIVSKNDMIFANHSVLPALDYRKVFQRFYRHEDTSKAGNGLGLSIIKQVCDRFGFNIGYEYRDQMHLFRIHFNK